jgi:hypothetical protein
MKLRKTFDTDYFRNFLLYFSLGALFALYMYPPQPTVRTRQLTEEQREEITQDIFRRMEAAGFVCVQDLDKKNI